MEWPLLGPHNATKGKERLWELFFFFSPSLPLLSALGARSGPRAGLRGEPLTPADTSFGTRNLLPSALKTHEAAFTPLCVGPGEGLQCASQEPSVTWPHGPHLPPHSALLFISQTHTSRAFLSALPNTHSINPHTPSLWQPRSQREMD